MAKAPGNIWRFAITLAITCTCLSVLGQGKILFANDSSHLFVLNGNALPVSPLPSGNTLLAVLYAGMTAGSLALQTSVTLDASGMITPGRMVNKNVLLTVFGGSPRYFQIFVMDTGATRPSAITGGAGREAFVGATYFGTSGLFTAIPGTSLAYPNIATAASSSTWAAGPLDVAGGCLSCYPPHFTLNPSSAVVRPGSNITFNSFAVGIPYPIYQWRKNYSLIPTATNSSLTLTNVNSSDAGNYDVLASNGYGTTASSVATLTVFVPVNIASGPSNQVVAARETATFSVEAAGYPTLRYRWLFNGRTIPDSDSSSLVIINVGTNCLGSYWVEVWNAYSSATSAPATLFMSPSLRSPFAGLVATAGTAATLAVSSWGSGVLNYQWSKDGRAVSGAIHDRLVFPAVQISDGGLYSVVVTSPYGSVTNTPAQLVINPTNVALGLYAGITIRGVPGWTYGIEATSGLAISNFWQGLTNITLTQPMELWVDQSTNVHSPTTGKRFYRVSRTFNTQ